MEMKRLGRYIVLVLALTVFLEGQVKAIVDIQNPPSSASVNRAESLDIQPNVVVCLKKKASISPMSGDDESSSVQYSRHLADENVVASSSDKQTSIHIAIIIACVVTAVVTFVFALLLFLCCHRRLGISVGDYSKDDNPLLATSTSDYASGSTNSAVLQNSFHRMSFQSCHSNISDKEQAVSLEENVESDVVDVSIERVNTLPVEEPSNIEDLKIPSPPLKPPPGRIPPPPALPPLKPPPEQPRTPPPCPCAPVPSHPPPPSPCAPALPPPPPLSPCSPAPPLPPRRQPSSGGGGPPPPPPPARGSKPGVRPPSLPKTGIQPPFAPPSVGMKGVNTTPRAKLKPFFWDKVLTHPGRAMVWHQIKAGSFQFNEEMMETLFGYVPPDKNKSSQNKESSSRDAPKFIQLIDPKKAQNLSILMRALNITTEEVCDALEQGNELPPELLENLLKMAPTSEEELKLRSFSGQFSQLGPAERFLKVLVDIPFAFQRMETLHFMCTLEEEVRTIKESFLTLEAACTQLRDSRLFLKLLEAVLKTGNRMNDGTFRGGAQAFKLDTLLKLSDVKGVDGKITLLHFVVLEIIRSEGIRASRGDGSSSSFSKIKPTDDFTNSVHHHSEDNDSEEKMRALGLQVVSGLSGEMEDVKKAAGLDGEILSTSVAKLGNSMAKTRKFLNTEMKNVDDQEGFHQVLKCFVEEIDDAVMQLVEEEKRIAELVKSTADYFHGKPGKEEGLRLFTIVRDFLVMLDKACAQVAENFKKPSPSNSKSHNKDPPSKESSSKQNFAYSTPQQLPPDVRQKFIKAAQNSQVDGDFSSDDDDD